MSQPSPNIEVGLRLHRSGNLDEAEKRYRAAIEEGPRNAAAWHLLGLVQHQRGNHTLAIEYIGKAICLDATQAVYFNSFGASLLALNRFVEALACFRSAIGLRASYADAHANAAGVLDKLGQLELAVASYRQAVVLSPGNVDLLRKLGSVLSRAGDRAESLSVYEQALELAPENADLLSDLGNAWMAEGNAAKAARYYQRAVQHDPMFAAAYFNLGSALAEQDLIEDAVQAFKRAAQLRPEMAGWELRARLLCPTVFASAADLDEYRRSFEAQLPDIGQLITRMTEQELLAGSTIPPFPISFQGRPSRAIKESFAELVRKKVKPLPLRARSGKPRIGFVVTRGHERLFLRCSGGIVEHLDRSEFQVVVCCPSVSIPLMQQELRRDDITWVPLRENLAEAADRIAEARCDVLYYWEVGSDSLNYLLPFKRLAPVQCTSWGTQVTSGVREVDYYLSSSLIERDGSQNDFTENLWLLDSLPTFQRRISQPPPTQKEYFGLSPSHNIYLCPQTLLKMHPDQDVLFGQLLEADPKACLVLKEGRYPASAEQLKRRFQTTLCGLAKRVVIFPWLSREDYYRLISVADVVLDVVHYTAGSSCYDMFSLNKPLVTLPGELNVGRYTQACYRRMGLTDLIASSTAHYISLATQAGSDVDFRRHVTAALTQRTDILFEDRSAVRAHSAFFQAALDRTRSRQ